MYLDTRDLIAVPERPRWRPTLAEVTGGLLALGLACGVVSTPLLLGPPAASLDAPPVSADPTPTPVDVPEGRDAPDEVEEVEAEPAPPPPPQRARRRRARARPAAGGLDDVLRSASELAEPGVARGVH